MPWPDDRDLPVEVEAAFGADITADPGTWSWTDLSSRLLNEPIRTTVNPPSPGTCAMALLNDDLALTPLHPLSPYWPNVELGTPVRVRLRRAEDAWNRTETGGWGTAPSGQVWTVANGPTSAFSASGGVARHSHTVVNTLRRIVLSGSLLDTEQVIEIAPPALMTGAALVTGVVARYSNGGSDYYWLRCEFNPGGTSVMLKITKCVGGTFTDLATLNPVPGLAYSAGGYLRVRASVVGANLALKAWNAAGVEPSGWQLTVVDRSISAVGGTGTQSWVVGGNTNTLPITVSHRSYTVRVERFSGYADQWEPDYLPTGVVGQMSSVVRLTCSGVLRRLSQGNAPEWSPMRRTFTASNPAAYWPVEDGLAASRVGSAIPGQQPLAINGTVTFTDVADYQWASSPTLRYGTSSLADLGAGASLSADVPATVTAATSTAWTVVVGNLADVTVASGDVVLLDIATPGGTFVRWQAIRRKATLRTQLVAYNSAGAATTVIDESGILTTFNQFDVSVWQSGGTIQAGITWYLGSFSSTGSVAGTLAGITNIGVNTTRATQPTSSPMPFGHLGVWAQTPMPAAIRIYEDDGYTEDHFRYGAAYSWWRETAVDRLSRLCQEERVTLDTPRPPSEGVTRMGWQPKGRFGDLVPECVEVDGGLLYEQGFALGYLPRSYRYNQPADLTLNLATYAGTEEGLRGVLDPVYDDQDIRNQWTVQRRDGSFVVASDTDSQRKGFYSDSVELNLLYDADLPNQAGWRLHLGTVVDMRESYFPIDLAGNPTLIDGWLSCRIGSRIVRTNPPAQYPPGPLDRLVVGWTETLGPRTWVVQVTPAPAAPWDVATVDGPQRVAADGSTLAASLSTSGATLSLASTTANGPWTTSASDFPLDVRVGGEQVRLSAITGASSPQTATISARGLNGVQRAWPAGTPVQVWQPAVVAL